MQLDDLRVRQLEQRLRVTRPDHRRAAVGLRHHLGILVESAVTADPRNAVLSLKQVSIKIPAGMALPAANAMVARFGAAAEIAHRLRLSQ